MKRCEREAFDAARELFGRAGLDCWSERGGKHLMIAAKLPSGETLRIPLASSPAHGPTGAANLAVWTARKALRQRGLGVAA